MNKAHYCAPAVAVATALVLLAGCSTGGTPATTKLVGDVSEPYGYTSLSQLAGASPVIVVARGGSEQKTVPADAEAKSGLDATVTQMRVVQTLKGKLSAGDSFDLWQTGTHDGAPQEIVQDGQDYLLYLQPFSFLSGPVANTWVTTSLSGAYKASTSGEYSMLGNVGQASILPAEVTQKQARDELS